jgi:hypothetical protein
MTAAAGSGSGRLPSPHSAIEESDMEQLHFDILIDAPRDRVWDLMLADTTYRIWTAPFADGSYFEGSWGMGQEIRFMAPGKGGMLARIADNRLHEFLSIEHRGMISADGVVDTTSDEVKAWAPAYENYTFTAVGDRTRVSIDMKADGDFANFLRRTWPVALGKLKKIAEDNYKLTLDDESDGDD